MPKVEITISAEVVDEEVEEFEALSESEQEAIENEVKLYLEDLAPDDSEEEFGGEWHYKIEVTVH